MPAFDPVRVAFARRMVALFFGFNIPNGMNILSRTGTPLGAAHVAGGLNDIGVRWLPVASQGRFTFDILTPQQVFNKNPAGELMRLCYEHIADVTAAVAAASIAEAVEVGGEDFARAEEVPLEKLLTAEMLETTRGLTADLREKGDV